MRYLLFLLYFGALDFPVLAQDTWLAKLVDQSISGYEPRVVAWSKEGHGLVAQEMNTEFRVGTGSFWQIIDFVTDRILASMSFHSDELVNPGTDRFSTLLKTSKEGLYFQRLVDQLGIQETQSKENGIFAFPYLDKTTRIDIAIGPPARVMNEDGVEVISSRVLAISKGKSKTLGQTSKVVGERVRVVGYFKSPFENRIACLVVTEGPAFEGSPSLYYEFFGCKTDSGFK